MHLYNSTFTGWESAFQDHDKTDIQTKTVEGFNCKIPFFKNANDSKIHFSFTSKQNISIEAGLLNANGELLVAVEKWYHAGEYTLPLDVSNLSEGLHFLSIKTVGRFLVNHINLLQQV
jgi:hypothetical protein